MNKTKPAAYFIGALNAFTTSHVEAAKESRKYPIEPLYSASDYEAQEKRIVELEEMLRAKSKAFNIFVIATAVFNLIAYLVITGDFK